MSFTVQTFFNPYLEPDATRIDAVLTVNCKTEGAATVAQTRLAIFMIDCSGSMFDGKKIESAKHALRRAIATLPNDVMFCVIAFGNDAHVIVPASPVNANTKSAADRLVQQLDNLGGTEMSKALAAARVQAAKFPNAIVWAMFLTDGQNAGEKGNTLANEIARCKGAFQCDCRGLGVDWDRAELTRISNALLGTADVVPADPKAIENDFKAALASALAKSVGGVTMELWMPTTSKLVSLRQKQPEDIDILPLAVAKTDRIRSIDIGSWGNETRDYHAVFEVEAGAIDDEMRVCRPYVVTHAADGSEVKAPGEPIVAIWNADAGNTARINPEVAHYTGQAEISASIEEGMKARSRGNEQAATRLLGRAAQLAAESGNEEVTRRLNKVVDVVDAAQGTVRLRKNVSQVEELELEMGGTRTVRRQPVSK